MSGYSSLTSFPYSCSSGSSAVAAREPLIGFWCPSSFCSHSSFASVLMMRSRQLMFVINGQTPPCCLFLHRCRFIFDVHHHHPLAVRNRNRHKSVSVRHHPAPPHSLQATHRCRACTELSFFTMAVTILTKEICCFSGGKPCCRYRIEPT